MAYEVVVSHEFRDKFEVNVPRAEAIQAVHLKELEKAPRGPATSERTAMTIKWKDLKQEPCPKGCTSL